MSNKMRKLKISIVLVIIIILLGSGLSRATNTTNNEPEERTVDPGTENIIIMNFTINDGGDYIVNGTKPNPGTTLNNTQDGNWNISTYDSSGGGGWDNTTDFLGKDLDNDTRYSATNDTILDLDGNATNGKGSSSDQNVNEGDALDLFSENDKVIYNGSFSGGYSIWVDNGNNITEYDANDTLIVNASNSGFGVGATGTNATMNSSLKYYDINNNAYNYTEGDDIIWDTGGNGTFTVNPDTKIAGTSPSNNESYTDTGSYDSDWNMTSYDAVDDGGSFNSSEDAIIIDNDDNTVYQDVLTEFSVQNDATDNPVTNDEVQNGVLEFWKDNNDNSFDRGTDTKIGNMEWNSTKEIWNASGFIRNITQDTRFYVTMNASNNLEQDYNMEASSYSIITNGSENLSIDNTNTLTITGEEPTTQEDEEETISDDGPSIPPSNQRIYTKMQEGTAKRAIQYVRGGNHIEFNIDPTKPEHTIEKVEMTATKYIGTIYASVTQLNKKPEEVPGPGPTYTYLEINMKNAEDEELENATISFRVTKQWIQTKEIPPENIQIQRYKEQWKKLNTTLTKETNTHYKYRAKTPGFSYFAITTTPEIITSNEIDQKIYNNYLKDFKAFETTKINLGMSGTIITDAEFTQDTMKYNGETYESTWKEEDYAIIQINDQRTILTGTHRYGTRAAALYYKQEKPTQTTIIHWQDQNNNQKPEINEIKEINTE